MKRKDEYGSESKAFEQKCRKAGLKITPQRTAVYKALVESSEHPSAEKVYRQVRKRLPHISLDTVNRTLLTLSNIGVAYVVEGTGEAKRFDGCVEAHQHFKCMDCKRIIDFHYKPLDDIEVPTVISKRFEVRRKSVWFEGICDLCRRKK